MLPTLREQHRCIIFDNRGTGRSDVPPGPYPVDLLGDDAAARVGLENRQLSGRATGVAFDLDAEAMLALGGERQARFARRVRVGAEHGEHAVEHEDVHWVAEVHASVDAGVFLPCRVRDRRRLERFDGLGDG